MTTGDAPGPTRNSHYLRQWWTRLSPAAKRRYWFVLALPAAFWLAGARQATHAVAGIARLSGLARPLMALCMGGFGFLWAGLKGLGIIQETAQKPNLLWLPLAMVLPAALYGVFRLLDQSPDPLYGLRRKQTDFAHTQGRTDAEVAARELAVNRGVPFATVVGERQATVKVGLDYAEGEGHVLVTGPTRSGKGLHLTDTLLVWPGAALVVDPKGEQLARTAAWRSRFGPVYRLPGHRVRLAGYYHRLLDRDDVAELHAHLLRPWESRETIFAEKAISLFTAAGLYAQARGLDPLRVLLDLGESDPAEALAGLETVAAARRHVRIFTNGAGPKEYREDKFVTSAFGNFTTRLAAYQKHVDTIAPPDDGLLIDPRWTQRRGTVYITYSLQDLQGVGGVVAATIAAMLRYQMQRDRRDRLLVAVDELPAVGLRSIADYLATTGGYGITLLLYAQSIAQLQGIYGADGAQAILANCAHQVWYPPAEYETAETISHLYGLALKPSPVHSSSRGARRYSDRGGQARTQTSDNESSSWSWQERPALLPSQALALGQEQVLVATTAGRRYVFLGQRLNPIPLFDRLPPATQLRLPRPTYGERVYTAWQATGERAAGRTARTEPVPAAADTNPTTAPPCRPPAPVNDEQDDLGDLF